MQSTPACALHPSHQFQARLRDQKQLLQDEHAHILAERLTQHQRDLTSQHQRDLRDAVADAAADAAASAVGLEARRTQLDLAMTALVRWAAGRRR